MFRRKPTRGPKWSAGLAGALALFGLIGAACSGGGSASAEAVSRAFVVAEPVATTAATSSTSSTSSTTTSTTELPTTTLAPTTAPPPAPASAPAVPATSASGGAYCLGDSVMRAAGPALLDVLSMCGVVDAVESRQVRNAGDAASAAAASGASVVVIHLGHNGPFTTAQLDSLLAPLGGVPRVVLVTVQTSGTRAHQATVNAELRAAASRYSNVHIADFEAATNGQPGLFAADGIHLGRSGANAYARVIAGAIG